MAFIVRTLPRFLREKAARPEVWLAVFVVGLTGYRLTLIDRGHFFWGDEVRYLSAAALLDDFQVGEYRGGAGRLFESFARPGFVLASLIPAGAQRLWAFLAGVGYNTPASFHVVSAFNVLVSLGITLCMFRLATAWSASRWHALFAAIVFSLLCYSNFWIRHLMPYYLSLLLYLHALTLLSMAAESPPRLLRRAAWAGALSAFGHLCYPTYYLFMVINVAVLLAVSRLGRAVLAFTGAAAGVVAAFELIARFGRTSYVSEMTKALAAHARQRTQGCFEEGFVFAWRYLHEVEGVIGVALFVLTVGFVANLLWRKAVVIPRAARVAVATAVACYLLHASLSVFLHKTIFFGRILGMYLPIVVCSAILALTHIPWRSVHAAGVAGLMAASAWSFGSFAIEYAKVVYPADFLLSTLAADDYRTNFPPGVLWGHSDSRPDSVEELDPQIVMVSDQRKDGAECPLIYHASHETAYQSGARYIGVNLKWVFYYRDKDDAFTPPLSYRLLASAASPIGLAATGFEAYRPWERKRQVERQYVMRIYGR